MGLIIVQWGIIIRADYSYLPKSFKTNKQTKKSQRINPDKVQMFGKQIGFCRFMLKILNNMKRAHTLKWKFLYFTFLCIEMTS